MCDETCYDDNPLFWITDDVASVADLEHEHAKDLHLYLDIDLRSTTRLTKNESIGN